jgi:hypothetical protein
MVSSESTRQEFRSSSITKGVTHLSHEVNMQGIEPRATTPQQIQFKTEQSSSKSELSSSWNATSRPYSPAPLRPVTPGSRVPNPEGLMMEKLWSPARAPSPALKPDQAIERSSSPFPSAEARSMEKQWTPSRVSTLSKTSESVERSASPRPRSEGLQMEKLWAHKYEKKSESVNVVQEQNIERPTVEPTALVVQPPAPSVQPQVPLVQPQTPLIQPPAPFIQPQAPLIQNQAPLVQPKVPAVQSPAPTQWKQEDSYRNFSQSSSFMSETRSQTTMNEQKRVDPPFMAPTPKPVFQPISPEKQVQHYVAATEKVVHKLNPMYDSVETTSQSMSQFQSQSSSMTEQNITTSTETPENGESNNPNVVTERGVKPSEAKRIWAQRMASASQSGVSMSMPKPILKKQPAIKQQSAPSQDESLEMLGLVPGSPPEIGYMHRHEENNAIARTVETQRQSAPKEPLKAPTPAFAKTPSPAPKSNVTPTRQIRTSPAAKRSLTPTFTVKPFEPFQPLEPFPFKPDPEAPRSERLPPPPTPTRFEKGDFSSDVERDLDSVRIAAKWRPYESDNEDQPTYRRVRPPSTPLFNSRPKSTEPEPLPPSRFERPIDIEPKTQHTPAGLQLSDFKSAMSQSSNLSTQQQSSSSTMTSRRLATSMEQRVTHSSSTTTTKTSGSPAFSSAKHDVLKKPLSPPKKRGEFLPESGYMADTDEPRRQLKKQAEEQVVKEIPPPVVQHTPEPKIHKISPVMRETPLQQKVGLPLSCCQLLFVYFT